MYLETCQHIIAVTATATAFSSKKAVIPCETYQRGCRIKENRLSLPNKPLGCNLPTGVTSLKLVCACSSLLSEGIIEHPEDNSSSSILIFLIFDNVLPTSEKELRHETVIAGEAQRCLETRDLPCLLDAF